MRVSAHVLPLRLIGLVACMAAGLATASCQMPLQGRGVPEPAQAAPPAPPPAQPAEVKPAPQPAPAQPAPAPISDGIVRIGLLLPLSGSLTTTGNALLEAAQLAVFELADDRFMLIVRDTGETRESVIAAAESVINAGARLIVGPLQGSLAREIAPVAQRAGVGVITFSNDAKAAGDGVYVLGAAPEEQVARVVAYAAERGLKRMAAIVPDDAYGSLVTRAFQEAAAKSGVDIVAIQATNANGEELSRVIRRVTRYDERRAQGQQLAAQQAAQQLAAQQAAQQAGAAAQVAEQPQTPLPETTPAPFEAVLVAASIDRSREIATYLSHYDAAGPTVRLLGTGLWTGASFTLDRPLQGAWFPSGLPEVRQRFEARFRQAFRHQPSRLAGLAYDATALAALLARSAQGTPDYGATTLKSAEGFIGTEGLFRFRKDGVAERALAVYEITSAGPLVVSEPPSRFESTN